MNPVNEHWNLTYSYLKELKKGHPAIKILSSNSCPLVISFLFKVFVAPSRYSIPFSELESKLGDYIYDLQDKYGEEVYSKGARYYLDRWVDSDYLRKFDPDLSDEPECDLTPATVTAIEWVQGLGEKQFVGAESRLRTIMDLLADIVLRTETDPETKIQELVRKKQKIELEIENIRSNGVLPPDSSQVKERFIQAEETARGLLNDFRQIEENFRHLDKKIRNLIITSDKGKGDVLDLIFLEQNDIENSPQGKSFQSFWELLISPTYQQELEDLLEGVYALKEVEEMEPSLFLSKIQFSLLGAGERVQATKGQLISQLRRFLDNRTWQENKRILGLIGQIEKYAITLKEQPPKDYSMPLGTIKPNIDIPVGRKLFVPPIHVDLDDVAVEAGNGSSVDMASLYEHQSVDELQLRANIDNVLSEREQISLVQLVNLYPIEHGLEEIVFYMNMAFEDSQGLVERENTVSLDYQSSDGVMKRIEMPMVIFIKKAL